MTQTRETFRLIYFPSDLTPRGIEPFDKQVLEDKVRGFLRQKSWGTDDVELRPIRCQSRRSDLPPGLELEFRIHVNLQDQPDPMNRAERIYREINQFLDSQFAIKNPELSPI